MSFLFKPWRLLVLIAAGTARGDHQRAIEYLMAENHVCSGASLALHGLADGGALGCGIVHTLG